MRPEDLTKTLDLTALAPGITEADIERVCAEAREHHFAALCSYPQFVPLIAERLRGCDVKTCSVIDFPGGRSSTADKVREAERAVAEGADELDVVMNYPRCWRATSGGSATSCGPGAGRPRARGQRARAATCW